MAKRMTDEEIAKYIQSKSITQDQYVAPTVQTHVDTRNRAPAMVQVAQTVKPTQTITTTKTFNNKPQSSFNTQSQDIRTVDTVNKKQDKPKEKISILKTLGNIATNMGEGALKTGEGVIDTLNDIADAINNPLTYAGNKAVYGKETADKALKESKQKQEEFIKEDLVNKLNEATGWNDYKNKWEEGSLVKSGNFAGQVAQGVGGMVPSLLAGRALGFNPKLKSLKGLSGAQKAATMAGNVGKTYLSQLPANAILTAQSYGSGLEEALNEGASRNKARAYGLSDAAIEQLTEMMTGGVPGLEGKGGIDQFVDPLINKNTNGYLNALLKAGYGALGEGLEESTSEYLNALARKGILGKDIDWNEVNKNALRSGLVGAATGAILNTPTNIQNIQDVRTENQIRNALGDDTYAEGNLQYNPDYKGWENQREENRVEEARKEEESKQRRAEFERIQQERAQEEARKAQELAQERQKEQERIREQERQKTLEEAQKRRQKTINKNDDYNKYYKNADLKKFDDSLIEKSKGFITGNKQGKRTKEQWLAIAKDIGKQAQGMDAEAIKKYAYESFKYERPNVKENLNRQGKNYVSFKVDEWVDAVQKAAQSQSSPKAVQSSVETEQQTPQIETKELTEDQKRDLKGFRDAGMYASISKEQFLKNNYSPRLEQELGLTREQAGEWFDNSKTKEYKKLHDKMQELYRKDIVKNNIPLEERSDFVFNAYDKNLSYEQMEKNLEEAVFERTTKNFNNKMMQNEAKNTNLSKEEFTKKWNTAQGKELGFTKKDIEEVYDQQKTDKKVAKNPNLAEKVDEPVLKVETPQQEKQHYIDSGMNEEIAKILSEMPRVEKQPLRERIKEGKAKLSEEWSYLKRNLVDKGETIYTLGKKTKNPNLYAKYDKRGTTTGEANYDIGVAQTDLQGKRFNNFTNENGKKTSMSLNQIWEGVDPQVANEYLAHYLNVDRYKQVNENGRAIQDSLQKQIDQGKITQEYADKVIRENKGNKYVFGPSITDQDSLKKVKQLEKEYPELKRFGENVWQYGKNQLQNMVDAGKISQAQADQFLKETPHYVRLQRNVETKSSPLLEFDKKGNVKVNKNIKEFKGSTLDILPFKESMAQYTLDVRNGIRDNIFAQELAKTLGIGSNGEMVTDIDDMMGTNPDLLKDNGDGTYSLTFFNKGVATTIPINQGIYESLQPNKHFKFEDRMLFKGVRKVDNIRKALLTDKNPMFLATNMMKDAFDAPLNSKYPASFVKNYPRALYEIMKNGKNYQQYQALGGLQNSYFDNQQFQKQGSKYNPLTWVEKANNAIEQIPRLAEFISTMEKTGDVDQAMYNAAEVTTNFKRGGDVTKAANRNGATFLNASVQGFSKQIRNFTDIQNPKQAVQMLGKVLALGVAPGLLNDLMWDDDDEYKDMQDYQKDRYYLFKGKDGNWIRIPKGRAVSIFQSAARRTKYALGGQEDAFKGFGKFASDQVAPNNPFENNIISPFVDVARNESWSGNPIVSESIKNETHPEEEYTIKTDEFSKWLGKKTGQSPAKINYLIDQYSGAIGDIVLPNITKKVSSKSDNVVENTLLNPLKDKFTTNAVTSSKSQNDFYEALSKAEDNKKWSKATEEDKARYKYLYNKNLEISEIRKEMVKVQESDKSNKEKYNEVMEYNKEINRISKDAVENSKNIKKPSDNEFVIGDKHYTVTDGQVNALKDETVQKAKEYGLSVGDYADITSHYGTIKADKDENGNTIAGSKKKKFIDYVEAKEELSQQQKIAIIQKYYKKYTGE